MRTLFESAANYALDYLESINDRSVAPTAEAVNRLSQLDGQLPDAPTDPEILLRMLHEVGSPATVTTAGSRFFGFVIGGALPASVAANWLAGAWDQNAGLWVASPIAAALEQITLRWLLDVLGLPSDAAGAFVTGATMANFTALAAA